MKIEIDDDHLAEIILAKLKQTRKELLTAKYRESDFPHLIHATETLIRWYGKPDESFK